MTSKNKLKQAQSLNLNENETAKLITAIRDCSEETKNEIAEKLESL